MSEDSKVGDESMENTPVIEEQAIEEKFNSPKRRKRGDRNRGNAGGEAGALESHRVANG